MVKVLIPAPLRKITQNQSEVNVNGSSIEEIINNIDIKFPGVKEKLYGPKNNLRKYLNIYVDKDDIRFLDGIKTAVGENNIVFIVPQLAGGNLREYEEIEGLGVLLSLIKMGVITDDNLERYTTPRPKEVDYYNLLDPEMMYYKPRPVKPKFR